jgi:hypothetical protein
MISRTANVHRFSCQAFALEPLGEVEVAEYRMAESSEPACCTSNRKAIRCSWRRLWTKITEQVLGEGKLTTHSRIITLGIRGSSRSLKSAKPVNRL